MSACATTDAAASKSRDSASSENATSSEPALEAEEREQADERDDHAGKDHPERPRRLEARELDVHPEEPGDQGQRQQHDREDGEHSEDVVLPVRDDRLVRVLERFDDFLVVVEDVPDALRRVDDVVEVQLELLRKESLDVTLE